MKSNGGCKAKEVGNLRHDKKFVELLAVPQRRD
jgi:hypothetical protein